MFIMPKGRTISSRKFMIQYLLLGDQSVLLANAVQTGYCTGHPPILIYAPVTD